MKYMHWIAVVMLAMGSEAALAQAGKYPVRPVRILVGFAAGGATDIIARSIAPGLGESLGQSFVVENRPGASSQIAGELVAKSPPDGHVLLMTTQTLMTSQMIEKRTYPDLTKDFAAVALCATSPLMLVVNPSLPVRSLKELIALARARPGELNYGSGGIGTTPHLSGELFATMARLKIVHVPYKGEAPAITDTLAGHLPFMFTNVTASLSQVKAGKLRVLAVTGLERTPVVPGVATMSESGLPGFEATTWHGVVVPAATPDAVVQQLNRDINAVLQEKDLSERLAGLGAEVLTGTPRDFADYIAREIPKWTKVVKDSGAKAD